MSKNHKPYVPTEVQDEEYVARILFAPSFIKEGKVGSTAFALAHLKSGPESDISVMRLSKIRPDKLKKCASRMTPRVEGDKLHGYCQQLVGNIRNINDILEEDGIDGKVDVIDTGHRSKKYHASIIIDLNGIRVDANNVEPEVMYIQTLLAETCSDPILF